jgi:hypothetical protein
MKQLGRRMRELIIDVARRYKTVRQTLITYNLFSRWWPRLEIDRFEGGITTTLSATDNDCYVTYVHITELSKLVGFVYQRRVPPV